jgi:hypothetical protein
MAYSVSQPTVSLIAESTFAKTDIHKFVELTTAVRVRLPGSTSLERLVGTLLSQTYTTSTGANEVVTVGLLQGIGQVYMAGSTAEAGDLCTASTNGFGIESSTNMRTLGIIVDGAGSSSTGRIYSVLYTDDPNL